MLRELLVRIGSDRHLSIDELNAGESVAFASNACGVYRAHFDGFTGARVDATFARLDHPAHALGQPKVAADTTIVIAGSGPSLAARAAELRRLRKRVSIWTSIRGAEALATHGLAADLVLVQHQTDLDAYFSVRHLRDRDGVNPLAHAPVILAEPRTPRALLTGIEPARVTAFDPACGWGLWPASLAWLACGAGARAIALAGIDLGRAEWLDPRHEPLSSLLSLVATGSPVPTVDLGDGAPKAGWPRFVLDDTVGAGGSATVDVVRTPWPEAAERGAALDSTLALLRDHVEAATMFRARALESRARGRHDHDGPLREAWSIMLGWSESAPIRAALQEGLGATFLPRFWRQPTTTVAGPLWRPVLLAADQIVRQAEAAAARVDTLVATS